jgi:bifunctional N-acetylglucosamine-1-phosphate-uridyltransferase/glucosamine-1-phosphate-acetyltransferase GlmU-like protein
MLVVIPMAGAGRRFAEAGYSAPKPLIDVLGKTMIQRVIENLELDEAKHIFIVQHEHRKKYNLDEKLKEICRASCEVYETQGLLSGALLSVLEARNSLNVDEELIITNSDQLVVTKPELLISTLRENAADGGFMTFKASGKSWSYARVNERGHVEEVAEKKEISDNATIGVYYWKSSRYFLHCADKFISRKMTTNGEYYVSPVFNEAIFEGKKIMAIESTKHVSLGTPELLKDFIDQQGLSDAK